MQKSESIRVFCKLFSDVSYRSVMQNDSKGYLPEIACELASPVFFLPKAPRSDSILL